MASVDIPKFNSWKGKTLYQVVSRLRRVKNTNDHINLFFLPNPVTKYYRREIHTSIDNTSCQSRASQSIRDAQEIPRGTFITSSNNTAALANGLLGVVDPLYPNNKGELGRDCNNNTDNCRTSQTSSDNVCFRPDVNARRRCRSAGMISRKFVGNNMAYCTDNKQYLHSRNRSIAQNEYVYIRQGDPTVKPGMNELSKSNVYSSNGLSNCPKYTISKALQNNFLQYIWLDKTLNDVTIPDGQYDVFDINNFLTQVQIANLHYYVNTVNNVKTVLLKIGYSTVYKTCTIETRPHTGMTGLTNASNWALNQLSPQLVVPVPPNSILGVKGLALQPGSYPPLNPPTYVFYAPTGGLLAPSFVPLYYKPSNSQFAVQGGVSSSARVLRLKYNEIQKAAKQTVVLGQSIGNSLAYHVPTPDYPTNIKAKMGYPLTCTPVVHQGGVVRKCDKFIYR